MSTCEVMMRRIVQSEVTYVNSHLPSIDMTATGKNIEKLRIHAGYSVRRLQMELGLSTPQAIYKWQRGETMPSLDNMAALTVLLRVKLDDIVIYKECV